MCQSGESTFAKRTGSVERKVFYRCTNLKELHFPKRVTEFGKGIFSQCSALKRVYIEGNPVDEEVFQDWDMWTTCYDMEEIIAPNMRITRFCKRMENVGGSRTCRLPSRTGRGKK